MSNPFNNEIRPAIQELAEDLLTSEQVNGAVALAKLLCRDENDRQNAILRLQQMMGRSPKRPLFYLEHEIKDLPDHTRHVVRYAGDYIDQMVKYCAYDKGTFFLKVRGLRSSLGSNLRKLTRVFSRRLLDLLTRFNETIYVPSKHEWDVEDRPHLFSAREAVLCLFIVKQLSLEVAQYSQLAQSYDNNEMLDYHYDKTQEQRL